MLESPGAGVLLAEEISRLPRWTGELRGAPWGLRVRNFVAGIESVQAEVEFGNSLIMENFSVAVLVLCVRRAARGE